MIGLGERRGGVAEEEAEDEAAVEFVEVEVGAPIIHRRAPEQAGIKVAGASPAFIRTPLVDEMLATQAKVRGITVAEAEAQFLAVRRPHIELHRAGTPEEVARFASFSRRKPHRSSRGRIFASTEDRSRASEGAMLVMVESGVGRQTQYRMSIVESDGEVLQDGVADQGREVMSEGAVPFGRETSINIRQRKGSELK
jgi:hypothetical protein